MKKLLLLFCALLCLGGSGAWATTVAWDGSTGNGGVVASGFGITLPDATSSGKVYTISSFTVGLRGTYTHAYYLAICTKKVATTSATTYSESNVIAVSNNAPEEGASGRFEYKFSKPVKLEKGVTYYVQFLTSNTPVDGAYSTIAQGVYVATGDSESYPLSIYSGSGTYTQFTPNFTATLTELATSEAEPWSSLNSVSITHAQVQRIKLVTPATNDYYRLSGFCLYLTNTGETPESAVNNYMIISKKSDATSTISTSNVVGISTNHPNVNGDNIAERFFFDDISLEGNTTYYLYFTASNTPSDGLYTLTSEKIKLSSTTTNQNVYWSDKLQNYEARYYATLDVLVPVTYNLKWNGNTIHTKTNVLAGVGDSPAVANPWDLPDYCEDYTYNIAKITSETTSVDVTLNWDGPFTFSTSYNDATWYYMAFNGEYLVYSATAPYHFYTQVEAVAAADNALWAFVGDPYNGVRIMNYAAGDGKYLNVNGNVPMEEATYPRYSLCEIGKNSYGFTLECEGQYLINYNSERLWFGGEGWGNLAAAAITLTTVNWKNVALAKLTLFATEQHMGDYFGVLETSITGTRSSINDGVIASSTRANYDAIVNYLYSTVALSVKKPETGYYRIYNATRGRYIGTEDGTPMTLDDATSASTVVKLVYDGEGKTYKIQMQGMELDALSNGVHSTLSGSGAAFTAEGKAGVGAFKNSSVYVHGGSSGEAPAYVVMGYSEAPASDAASGWTVTKETTVTVPLNYISSVDASYATLYLPFGATITGAKAYILTVEGEWAIPHEISEVPANTGVLLRADGEVTSVTATIKDDASATTTGNKLDGTNIDITADRSAGEYILGNDADDGLGFYQRKSGRKIGANKAYLKLDADLAVKGLLLNWDDADGINTVQGSGFKVQDSEIFNLAGQRMSRVQKGVNIVNGKKVLVK